ncbi:MAG: hypothetical protein EOT04_02300, partial [Candidatus Chaera renei]
TLSTKKTAGEIQKESRGGFSDGARDSFAGAGVGIDGGQIVYLLDGGKLGTLKFPSFWFENTSQGKFMLSIAFGQSKYYVDNLSENTKRGLRQKVRRGEYPGPAPIGYINDVRSKSIVVDKRRASIVVSAFQLYAKGNQRLENIALFLKNEGITTKSGKQLTKDQVKRMLSNPFYYGHFKYLGEVHEGKHKAIVSKKLFDDVQATLTRRGRPQKSKTEPQIFCGLLACASCSMSITAEHKIKRQKNGNVHEYVYYRCTKKRKDFKCVEPAVTEADLTEQLQDTLDDFAMPEAWASKMQAMLTRDEKTADENASVFVSDAQTRLANLQSKLQRLLDGYLDQHIDQKTYRTKQAELMSEKKSLEEQVSKLTLAGSSWIEPMRAWINLAVSLRETAKNAESSAIKEALLKIEGLNLFLKSKKAQPAAAPNISPLLINPWFALRATKEKTAHSRRNSDFVPNLVRERGLEPPRR